MFNSYRYWVFVSFITNFLQLIVLIQCYQIVIYIVISNVFSESRLYH